MGSEWEYSTLDDVGIDLLDCVHKTPAAIIKGLPYIAIPQMKNGVLDFVDVRLISEGDFKEWTKKASPIAWDIVLSRRCNPGVTAYVPQGVKFALGQNLVLLRADGKRIYPPFLRWVTKSQKWWDEVQKYLNVGAVFDSLRCADIPQFKITAPPLPTQRAIAHILGSLDDKIELNRQVNRTLEKMAAAIFKSWFIDFDPVHAKAKGRDPGLPTEIADLFPDSLVESELGLIPDGWEVKPIGDAAQCVGGATPSTKKAEFWDGGTNPFLTPKDMSSLTAPVILDTDRHITDAGVERISSKRLPAGTVILSSRAPIGYLAINEVPVSVNQGIIAMICSGDLPNHYIFLWTMASMETIKGKAGGTTFAEISKKNFRPIPALIPAPSILDAFTKQVEPLFQQIVENVISAEFLAHTRDTLLPKLISGELPVPEAEKLLEETNIVRVRP